MEKKPKVIRRTAESIRRTKFSKLLFDSEMTFAQLALTIGANKHTIEAWSMGERPPKPEFQPRIAKALGITLDAVSDLFDLDYVVMPIAAFKSLKK
jgi:DNA-binding XRE family transcriptional regulator